MFRDANRDFAALRGLLLSRRLLKIIRAGVFGQNVVNRPWSNLRLECALVLLLNWVLLPHQLDFGLSLRIPGLLIVIKGLSAPDFGFTLLDRLNTFVVIDAGVGSVSFEALVRINRMVLQLVVFHYDGFLEDWGAATGGESFHFGQLELILNSLR